MNKKCITIFYSKVLQAAKKSTIHQKNPALKNHVVFALSIPLDIKVDPEGDMFLCCSKLKLPGNRTSEVLLSGQKFFLWVYIKENYIV